MLYNKLFISICSSNHRNITKCGVNVVKHHHPIWYVKADYERHVTVFYLSIFYLILKSKRYLSKEEAQGLFNVCLINQLDGQFLYNQ